MNQDFRDLENEYHALVRNRMEREIMDLVREMRGEGARETMDLMTARELKNRMDILRAEKARNDEAVRKSRLKQLSVISSSFYRGRRDRNSAMYGLPVEIADKINGNFLEQSLDNIIFPDDVHDADRNYYSGFIDKNREYVYSLLFGWKPVPLNITFEIFLTEMAIALNNFLLIQMLFNRKIFFSERSRELAEKYSRTRRFYNPDILIFFSNPDFSRINRENRLSRKK